MNPDDLLNQIADLLQQYLSLGANTPVAPQAQQLMDAIQQMAGEPQGAGMPPDPSQAGPPSPDGSGMPPDMGAMPDDLSGMSPSGQPASNGGNHPLADASAMAIQDIMNHKKKTKA
jgi:hypothetical protein